MTTLGVRFLTPVRGREHADPALPEWPPHPARVVQALVATAHETGLIDEAKAGLTELCGAAPPDMAFESAAAIGRSPTVFVPRNQTSDHIRTDASRPIALPADPLVSYHWRGLSPTAEAVLARLAPNLSHLGRSSSLVTAEILDDASEAMPNWVPDSRGELQLRVAYPGYLDFLEAAWNAGQFPGPAPTAGYRNLQREMAESPWGTLLTVGLAKPFGIARSASILEALRNAVMSWAGDAMPAILHGHEAAAERHHVAWVGLPDVGHRYARGHLVGLGLWLPVDTDPRDAAHIALAMRAVSAIRYRGEDVGVRVTQAQHRKALDAATWAGPARQWASVTPMVLNRFPKKSCSVECIVADNCELIGLPRPRQVRFGRDGPLEAVPDSGRFRLRRPGRLYGHVRLRFDEPVHGPVLLGAERYFGMGMCRPVDRFSGANVAGD